MRTHYPPDKYPFSEDLYIFMEAHPEAEAALKLSSPERFVTIPIIFTSGLPSSHPNTADQVIGVWYFDKKKPYCNMHRRVCTFKQDFIVNVGKLGEEYVVYTADKKPPPYVQPLRKFFDVYGDNGKFYHDGTQWNHHYGAVQDLPNEPNLRQLASTIEANNQ
jgi:hypothetical protein